jgi:hypothetical protein
MRALKLNRCKKRCTPYAKMMIAEIVVGRAYCLAKYEMMKMLHLAERQ